ncbi:MAG: glycoside hydrolase family 28 protein [Candidatus Pedobacter colombiensis]|uniref:Glycoside hydrolase family 28 protein n=1 Tax=Candidatus Pedobacter colombiensis TaxID=3121371 RepID=A0AAJ5WAX8_9SPHI|nr:glycoside hydrolase family 28 protein [Pedobacter sp.]WEK20990.1 MAG: glycoside hydrolase family 28 protein [Pedobacter sp.]
MRNTILAVLLFLFSPAILLAQFNVKEFGAKGDGQTMDTRSIQQAIDKAFESKGGVVIVPAGTFKIGTLILKDNVNLHLDAGALLLGSPDYRDYTEVVQKYESRTRDLYARYFMIFAEGAKNISITGSGTIHGNGLKNFQEVKPQNLRPYMIRLVSCHNVSLNGISLLEAANWTLHLLGCKDVNVSGIVIENEGEGNRDGLDIDGCQRVTVANSRFSTTDDAIVMKATSDTLCQDIAITNCTFRRIGGSALKTGTESNGGFKNITISNCVIKDIPVHAGIELMTVDGGIMQNILIENISMEDVATPFFIRLGIRARPFKSGQYVKEIEDVKDISLTNISAINAKLPSSIIGLHNNKIKNVTISNYTARYAYVQHADPYNKVSFQEFEYPAAAMFSKLPAYGIYCRSVDELHLQNVRIYTVENEKRPAITFDRINNLELFSVKAEVKQQDAPMLYIRNSKGITAAFCKTIGINNALFEMEGASNFNVHLSSNILQNGQKETRVAPALADHAVFEDFDTEIKYTVNSGAKIQGLTAHDLKNPLKIKLNSRKGALQLCLLSLNSTKKPQKVLVKYDGIIQEFLISWNEWGWAPISLLKEYQGNEKVEFEIVSVDPNANLKIAKIYLRYQDIGFTD